jgi:predicted ATPase/DNA-binding CsgD family transcriptional regulator
VSLPTTATTFIGRQQELEEITRLLANDSCHLLTLIGPGGIGKTRLALEIAANVQGDFTDGVCFVPLAPVMSPDFLVSAICQSLTLTLYGEQYMKQQLLSFLSLKHMLLILDNYEHLLEDVSLLAEILAAVPHAKILITSRERLNLREEWVIEIPGLPFPMSATETDIESYSAIELFLQQAHRANHNFALNDTNKPAIIRIARLVGGMPLALELAAAWVRALPCEAIADEISHNLDILESPVRNVEPRHRNMRATFEPTWEQLTADEQQVFKKLSVFRGGFTREAAECVAGASLRILSLLVDKSLLRVDTIGRYDIHELLRQYGEERLMSSGEAEAMCDVHSAYFAAFLQQKWQPLRSHQQVKTLDEIGADFENVRTAWQTMVEKRNTTDLSKAVYPLWYFSDLRGRYHDAAALFKQAEDALKSDADNPAVTRVIGQMLSRRGFFYVSLGEPEEGQALAQEGLRILQSIGSVEDIVLAWDSICLTNIYLHQPLSVKQAAEQAALAAKRSDDRWLLARALYFAASSAVFLSDLEEGRRIGQECLELAEACGDVWLRALMWRDVVGGVLMRLGDYVETKRLYEQSLQLLEEVGQACMIADTHRELAFILYRMNEFNEAVYHYQQCLQILIDTNGYSYLAIWTLMYIAELWTAQGKREEAVELLTLILRHPKSLQWQRDDAGQLLQKLQAEVIPDRFATAQERGRKLDLRSVIMQLIAELSQPAQAALPAVTQSLPDPLTEREIEILNLMADGLSNREIADQLFLAVSTVKWYINQIFGKLHTANRTQAVARARALGLLSQN